MVILYALGKLVLMYNPAVSDGGMVSLRLQGQERLSVFSFSWRKYLILHFYLYLKICRLALILNVKILD